jgi:hypothetical protein
MMLLVKLESIEHARTRALAQIMIDKEKGVEAFEEYMKIAFPYMEAAKKRDRTEFLDRLKKEIGRGPLSVTAIPQPKMRSKMKTRMAERGGRNLSDQIYKKIGPSIPLR